MTELNWADRTDFENATRGLIDKLEPCVIPNAAGRVVWDNERWDFLSSECPDTVHPSLWRQGQLNAVQGLFEICPGIYQVRGLDCANMTIIEGETGVVVVDPLICVEVATAAWELYTRNRGVRSVHAVLYSHSHGDHFGGVHGVTTVDDVADGRCEIIAPVGFMEHAVSETLIAGSTMRVRATYQYGSLLPADPRGSVGGGLAQAWSSGVVGLIEPTLHITETGQEVTVDGVRMIFQLTPETEAPSEMNFYLPDHKVLLVAENANHTLHNILTLRGALVRDAHAWAAYLTETIQLFCGDADILIGSHNWPTWGRAELVTMLGEQRDAYSYIHDQAVRLMNRGLIGAEIAEEITEFPGELGRAWHVRGYYGTINHNVKAVYQRYMGWYDGNPAHLWQLPPAESGRRYVEVMGGPDAVVAKARESFAAGDHRWVAELLNHVVFAHPTHREARELQARNFEAMAFAQEAGTWRACFLTAADELREAGVFSPEERGVDRGASLMSPSILAAITNEQIFQMFAVRLDGPRAAAHPMVLGWDIDGAEVWTTLLCNGVFTPIRGESVEAPRPELTVHLDRPTLTQALAGLTTLSAQAEQGTVKLEGDPALLATFESLLERPARTFAVATP